MQTEPPPLTAEQALDAFPLVIREGPIGTATAAKILGVDITTVRKWIAAGKLEAIRRGGDWVTSVQACYRFFHPERTATTTPATSAQRKRADKRAMRELAEMGMKRRG